MVQARTGTALEQARRYQEPTSVSLIRTGNERGMALILALVMLVLLTILGAWALDTSSTDLKIAGNSTKFLNAFYTADGGIGFAINPTKLTETYLAANNTKTFPQNIGSGSAVIIAQFLTPGPLPQGSIYDSELENGKPKFSGLYFAVNSTGNSAVALEAGVVQVVGN
jgi:hypothetical protein